MGSLMEMAPSSSPREAGSAIRFTLRDLFVLMLLFGAGLGWWTDHRRMQSRLDLADLRLLHLQKDQQRYRSLQREYSQLLKESEAPSQLADPSTAFSVLTTPEDINRFVLSGPKVDSAERHFMVRWSLHWKTPPGTSAMNGTVPRLVMWLGDRNEQIRARSALALGALANPDAELVSALIPLLNDPAPTVQWHAANALGEFRGAAQSAIPALEACMLDDDCHIAAFAAYCLTRIDPQQRPGPRFIQLVTNKHPQNRIQAIQQLRFHVPHDEVAQVLSTAFVSEKDPEVRDAIAIALNRLGP